jgi:hypothetical protein
MHAKAEKAQRSAPEREKTPAELSSPVTNNTTCAREKPIQKPQTTNRRHSRRFLFAFGLDDLALQNFTP